MSCATQSRCFFDLQSFTGTKHSLGDVWFVIKYLLMLFRQHIFIPNYLNVDLGQCSAKVSSKKKEKVWHKRVFDGSNFRKKGFKDVKISFAG